MKCKIYLAKKDKYGYPIPGTMMGYDKDPCKCSLVHIPAVTASPQAHQQVGRRPGGQRYFVRINDQGHIIPNSLVEVKKNLKPLGCGWVEFIKLIPA